MGKTKALERHADQFDQLVPIQILVDVALYQSAKKRLQGEIEEEKVPHRSSVLQEFVQSQACLCDLFNHVLDRHVWVIPVLPNEVQETLHLAIQ